VELTFLRNSLAVCRYEIAGIASKWVNPSLSLGRDQVDIKLIRWSRENGNVVCPLFTLKVVPRSVERLGSRKLESCVFRRGIEFYDRELLKSCALASLVPD
jgi:hypothetical protein